MSCSGGTGCLDCVKPFSYKMSFDFFLSFFFLFCRGATFTPHCYKTADGTVLERSLCNRSERGFLLMAESPQPQSDELDGCRK